MPVKRRFARAFTAATGYELRKTGRRRGRLGLSAPFDAGSAPMHSEVTLADLQAARLAAADRLLEAPAFIMSSVRSGSTLLRVLLNTHSHIHSPHELHLRNLTVQLTESYVARAMSALGSDETELQYLLWDRILHRELVRHDKSVLVNKTPDDVLMWRQVLECWPDARFIFLLRHPVAMIDSWHRARKQSTRDRAIADVSRFVIAIQEARHLHPGLTLRYEDLTAEPERETRRVCEFLGLDWEREMLSYGEVDHGEYKAGLGDWSRRIRSGKVLPARPVPTDADIPTSLRELCAAWGYLHDSSTV